MRTKDFNVHDLISSLIGTCSTMREQLPVDMDEDDLTDAEHEQIDGEIFCCESCGWWCEINELSNDGETCNDCE